MFEINLDYICWIVFYKCKRIKTIISWMLATLTHDFWYEGIHDLPINLFVSVILPMNVSVSNLYEYYNPQIYGNRKFVNSNT